MNAHMISREDAEALLSLFEANEAARPGDPPQSRLRRRHFRGPVIHTRPQILDAGDSIRQRLRLVVDELDGRSFPLDHVVFLVTHGRLPSPTERMQLQAEQLAADKARAAEDEAKAALLQQQHEARLAQQMAAEAARRAAVAAELAVEADEALPEPEDTGPAPEAAPEPAQRPARRDLDAMLADGKVLANPELRDVAPPLEAPHEGMVTHRSRRAAMAARRASA